MEDRIDALLEDLEAASRFEDRHARLGELAEATAGQAAEKSFLERLRGALGHQVRITVGDREVLGCADFLGAGIVGVIGHDTTIVATDCITELRTRSRQHRQGSDIMERLGMASALRRWAVGREEIAVLQKSRHEMISGSCDMVAADYIEIAGRVIPFSAIAMVSSELSPFELSRRQNRT